MATSLARGIAIAAVLVTLYYLLPMDNLSDSASVVFVVVALLAIAVLLVWQLRSIVGADYPAIKAINALITTIPLFLLVFATTYYLMEHATPDNFSAHLTRTDSLYFTVTTFSTTGFGDITAKSQTARLVVTVQMLADLVVIGFGIKLLVSAVQRGWHRRSSAEASPSPSTAGGEIGGPAS